MQAFYLIWFSWFCSNCYHMVSCFVLISIEVNKWWYAIYMLNVHILKNASFLSHSANFLLGKVDNLLVAGCSRICYFPFIISIIYYLFWGREVYFYALSGETWISFKYFCLRGGASNILSESQKGMNWYVVISWKIIKIQYDVIQGISTLFVFIYQHFLPILTV